MADSCGTGFGNFPKPGDPDLNNSILQAVPAFGGIDVFWTYPQLLPEAVSHVLLYRSSNADPETKVKLKTVTGEIHFDRIDPNASVRYYYWIEIVSVNGTVGDLTGPASAMSRPTIEQTVAMLTGQITSGQLATSLGSEINRIESIRSDLTASISNSEVQYEELLIALADFQTQVDGVGTVLVDEVARLETYDSAQAQQINVVGAVADDSMALITQEVIARADADTAMAQSIDTLEASVGRKAQVFFQTTPPPDVATYRNDLWVDIDDANTLYRWSGNAWEIENAQQGLNVFRQAGEPVAQNLDDVWFDSDDGDQGYVWDGDVWFLMDMYIGNTVAGTVQDFSNTQVGFCMIGGSPDSTKDTRTLCLDAGGTWLNMASVAEAVKGVQIVDGEGGTANVEQRMVSYKDALGDLNAEYTAKVQTDVDGNTVIGGFGLTAESGTGTVEAGFDVDTFWVGKLGNKKYPFIITGSEVFIDAAVIQSLTIDKLRSSNGNLVFVDDKLTAANIDVDNLDVASAATFSGDVQSDNYVSDQSGWNITQDGDFEVNNLRGRGSLEGSIITGSSIKGSVIQGSAFVALTEFGGSYTGLTSNLTWSDSRQLGDEVWTYLPYIDIYSGNYSDTGVYRRYRRSNIDATLVIGPGFRGYRVYVYKGASLIIDTGYMDSVFDTPSGTGWNASVVANQNEVCTTNCDGQETCDTETTSHSLIFNLVNYYFDGDDQLRFRVYSRFGGPVNANTQAINDY
jgi:hypothetical protein